MTLLTLISPRLIRLVAIVWPMSCLLASEFPYSVLPYRITLSARVLILDFRLLGHRMTLSALAKTFGGIIRPICLAALRLITSSNFLGLSMGKSPGFVPLRILST
jgi:hypothetical protein